jgi:hypothetical protein
VTNVYTVLAGKLQEKRTLGTNSYMCVANITINHKRKGSIPEAARSKASVCGSSLTGIVGSNTAGSTDVSVVSVVVCCQVEVSATGWSLVQRSPTECGVSKVRS